MNHAILGVLTWEDGEWVGWAHLPLLAAMAETPPTPAMEVVRVRLKRSRWSWWWVIRRFWRSLRRAEWGDLVFAGCVMMVCMPIVLPFIAIGLIVRGPSRLYRRVSPSGRRAERAQAEAFTQAAERLTAEQNAREIDRRDRFSRRLYPIAFTSAASDDDEYYEQGYDEAEATSEFAPEPPPAPLPVQDAAVAHLIDQEQRVVAAVRVAVYGSFRAAFDSYRGLAPAYSAAELVGRYALESV